jgi:hypothetical protein
MLKGFTGRIFFYCFPQGVPERAAFQHSIICLAEGFKSLGIKFFSNINYWRTSIEREEYLFSHDPLVRPDDCSVVIINDTWVYYANTLPDNLFHPGRSYITIYMDDSDENITPSWNPEFRQFDFIFRTHYNKRCKYPANLRPWAFGLSERIIQETNVILDFKMRKRQLLVNFRSKHPVRKLVQEKFLPHIQDIISIDDNAEDFDIPPIGTYHYLQWAQTGRRHYPDYYRRLKESAACACFGGRFIPNWPRNHVLPLWLGDRILNKLDLRAARILQWDSWRFWESLAAGCVTFHVDFKKYGLLLPVMPINWHHYIGIDLDNIKKTVNRIADNPTILESISREGRQWALEHYSPLPTAQRFIGTIQSRLLRT